MLQEPSPSPFDLRWRMFGIPVRVHPTFWLFGAFFGMGYLERWGFYYLLLWIGCMFFSILIHELGHVVAGRLSGQPGQIVLYWMGGLAMGQYQLVTPWQRIFIFAAGPLAGFFLYALAGEFQHLLMTQIDPAINMLYLHRGAQMLLFMNLMWNLFNLLPVFPLDGGQIMREVCILLSSRHGLRFSLGLSCLLAGAIAGYAVLSMNKPAEFPLPRFGFRELHPLFLVIMFAIMAIQNFMMLFAAPQEEPTEDDDDEASRDEKAIDPQDDKSRRGGTP